MGCGGSWHMHPEEKGIAHKDLQVFVMEMQSRDFIKCLDTDNDQKGRVAVDCIFRPTREIYGQKSGDLKKHPIKWLDYGIAFQKRPFPHDFPAFAHEKPAMELAKLQKNIQIVEKEGSENSEDLVSKQKNTLDSKMTTLQSEAPTTTKGK